MKTLAKRYGNGYMRGREARKLGLWPWLIFRYNVSKTPTSFARILRRFCKTIGGWRFQESENCTIRIGLNHLCTRCNVSHWKLFMSLPCVQTLVNFRGKASYGERTDSIPSFWSRACKNITKFC